MNSEKKLMLALGSCKEFSSQMKISVDRGCKESSLNVRLNSVGLNPKQKYTPKNC